MIEAGVKSATFEKAAQLRQEAVDIFEVASTTLDKPETGDIRFNGHLLVDLSLYFDELKQRFERYGFTPFLREDDGWQSMIARPVVFAPSASRWLINLVLLVATILSTLYIGAGIEYATRGLEQMPSLRDLWLGWPYSASLMAILGAHEMGHYFAARYHKVPVTLPYFIPLPLPPVGTLGAFIRLKAPVKNKRALLDVGAAGPLAGLIVAIPIVLYGLSISPIEPLPTLSPYTLEGNSILYAFAKIMVKGQMLPNGSVDVFLGQVAWAGWVGLLITGLNLIPVGQLDGGHIAYALWGKRARQFFWPAIIILAALVVLTGAFSWAIWIFLLFLVGRYHAEPMDDVTPLDGRRRLIAILSLIAFILVFVPIPLKTITP